MKGRKRARKRTPDTVYLNVRIPIELHGKLVQAADAARPKRSLNDEILAALYRWLQRDRTDELLEEADTRIKKARDAVNEYLSSPLGFGDIPRRRTTTSEGE